MRACCHEYANSGYCCGYHQNCNDSRSASIEKEGLRARLILQVHDELIVEAPEEEAPLVQQLLTEEMEQAIHLSVPMVAEATIGKTWYDAKA